MEYVVEGNHGEGMLFFKASHTNLNWQLDCLTIQFADTHETETVIPCE
ncbi:hypothetical protein GCE9029_04127 [Grimontia celer]|uniref:Uncharacterized protein n=1 Tax=Grimontia celer TaxID=1796497 RepID=A0A128FB58_9GAMM|nr:hypothetical protein GCE9029_04127 [Grimontia celer]